MSFKPLKAAYEELSDTMTDGSFSVRYDMKSMIQYVEQKL